MMKPNVVFVHINTKFPEHLIANLRRMHLLFPEIDLHLVHNTENEIPLELKVKSHKLDISRYEQDFRKHKLNVKFRDGFWQTSLLRILILEQFHELFPLNPILHIESDVILMPYFPFDEISQLRLPHWNSFGNEADVGALIYSPTLQHTKNFVRTLREIIQSKDQITDMTALNLMRRKNPEEFKVFPTSCLDQSFKLIPFIFDGAILGMWLFGQDPRNNYGFQPRFRNLIESQYRVEKGTISLNEDGFLTLQEDSKLSQIVSLHIHCKDVRLFEPDGHLFKKRIRSASRSINFVLFRPIVFLHLAKSALAGNELKGFIYHFPVLGRLVRMIRGVSKAIMRSLRS